MSWSGGKDSAYALHRVLEAGVYDVKYLFTTIDGHTKTVAIHELPESLLQQQADQLDITLIKCYLHNKDNDAYETAMRSAMLSMQAEGIHHIIFGDLFLQDLRQYREEMMRGFGMTSVFPLWQMKSTDLVKDFVAKGFKSALCSVNEKYLPKTWAGKMIDNHFLQSLPEHVDPCGENGEYHSFCFDGPIFKNAVNFKTGDLVSKALQLNQAADTADSRILMWHLQLQPAARKLGCPRCQRSFECNSADIEHCKCNAVVISREVKDLIQSKYGDCLCASCLQELADR